MFFQSQQRSAETGMVCLPPLFLESMSCVLHASGAAVLRGCRNFSTFVAAAGRYSNEGDFLFAFEAEFG